jgi:hypothetical protein
MASSSSKSKNEIAPPIPSGFPRYKIQMLVGFILFFVLYFGVIAVFPAVAGLLSLPPSADEFCPNEKPCWRGDLFSFEVVSGIALMWAGVVGFYSWHVKGIHKSIPDTPEGRMFGYHEEGQK